MNLNFKSKQKSNNFGRVVWITGLSGAGKSTLARLITSRMRECGDPAVLLDGDELRRILNTAEANVNNHCSEARLALAMQYSHLCKMLASQGLTVVIATISMFREVHEWNQANLPGYFEAYLKVPLDELRRRDPKGIYRRYDSGQLFHVAGLDLPIEEPESPDWMAEFKSGQTIQVLADNLMKNLEQRK